MADSGIETDSYEPRRRWLKPLVRTALVAGFIVLIVIQNSGPDDTSRNEFIRRTPPSTTQASAADLSSVDLHQPFVGTPAARWQDGIAGLRLPKPKSIAEFTPEQVAQATQEARRFLAAVLLDRRVIETHDIAPALRLVAPGARVESPEDVGYPITGADPIEHAVQIHPKYPLLPATPKVSGRMTVESGGKGMLIVRANVSVAYAFDTPRPGDLIDPLDIVSVVRSEHTFAYLSGPRWDRSDRGLWPTGTDSFYYYSMSCQAAQDGLLAPAYSEELPEGDGAEPDPQDVFDPGSPIEDEGNCPDN